MKKFLWRSLLGMFLRGILLRYAYFVVLYKELNKVHSWFVKFSDFLATYRFIPYKIDIIMICQTKRGGVVILIVYIDDILLTRGDKADVLVAKAYLHHHFVTQDL